MRSEEEIKKMLKKFKKDKWVIPKYEYQDHAEIERLTWIDAFEWVLGKDLTENLKTSSNKN